MIFDYFIVGQGIAGTILAHKLSTQGKSVFVFDNKHKNSSTKIAAGIINPITGRKFVKSWMIDQLIPAAIDTYHQLENELDIKIVYPKNIVRVIFNEESQRHWERIQLDVSAEKYITEKPDLGLYKNILHPIHGMGELTNSYRIDMGLLISSFQNKLAKEQMIQFEDFDYDSIQFNESEIQYKGLSAKRIVFCEGYKAINNPVFKYLPFQPAKGQAVIFKMDSEAPKRMLRHRQFIVPFGNQLYWSGGGYQWDDLNESISDNFLDNWKADMETILKIKPTIISHNAAVRPAVKGRRPLLGNHPRHKNAYIFNGMGTKGASLTPFWADHFVSYLENDKELDQLVDISRFEEYAQF